MGKLAGKPKSVSTAKHRDRFRSLASEQKRLTAELAKVDQKLASLKPLVKRQPPASPDEIDKWFDQLTDGLDELPPLPARILI